MAVIRCSHCWGGNLHEMTKQGGIIVAIGTFQMLGPREPPPTGQTAIVRRNGRGEKDENHLQIAVHNIPRVEVLERRHNLGAVESGPIFCKHPFPRHVEEELKADGQI